MREASEKEIEMMKEEGFREALIDHNGRLFFKKPLKRARLENYEVFVISNTHSTNTRYYPLNKWNDTSEFLPNTGKRLMLTLKNQRGIELKGYYDNKKRKWFDENGQELFEITAFR